jgi:hypothetical protein
MNSFVMKIPTLYSWFMKGRLSFQDYSSKNCYFL